MTALDVLLGTAAVLAGTAVGNLAAYGIARFFHLDR